MNDDFLSDPSTEFTVDLKTSDNILISNLETPGRESEMMKIFYLRSGLCM